MKEELHIQDIGFIDIASKQITLDYEIWGDDDCNPVAVRMNVVIGIDFDNDGKWVSRWWVDFENISDDEIHDELLNFEGQIEDQISLSQINEAVVEMVNDQACDRADAMRDEQKCGDWNE